MKAKTAFICAGCAFALFLALIVVLFTVDVQPAGAGGTDIGLAALNTSFHDMTGLMEGWYSFTDVLGIVALLAVGAFGVLGLVQLVRRKSLLRVDGEILALGGLYAVTLAIYVLFEKFIVNYRPVLEKGAEAPEASFPSSHTMLFTVVIGSAALILAKYVQNAKIAKAAAIACWVLAAVAVIGRLLSGMHWLTDIVGGLLVSAALLFCYKGILSFIKDRRDTGKAEQKTNAGV